jgi:hypothetical protein
MSKLKKFFSYYSSNHAYTEYSFSKTLIWKIGVLRRFFGDLRGGRKVLHVNLEKLNRRHKITLPKPAIILATGPSLNEINHEFLNDFKKFGDIFSINYFPFTDIGLKSKIDYQVLLDGGFFTENPLDEVEEKFRDWLQNEFNGKLITQIGRNLKYKNESIFIRGLTAASFTKAINPMGIAVGFQPYSTLYAISTAIWLGYEPIYVSGLDASQHTYIYMREEKATLSNNHAGSFYPDSDKSWVGRPDSTSILSANAYVIEKMKLFRKYSVELIGNGSHIDTLPRVSLEQILTRHIKPEKDN